MTEFPEGAIYCIENQEEGKHHFIFDEDVEHNPNYNGFYCKYCFLPKSKANYRPMKKLDNGKFVFMELNK